MADDETHKTEPDHDVGKRKSVHDRPLTREEIAETADGQKPEQPGGGDYFEGWDSVGGEYS